MKDAANKQEQIEKFTAEFNEFQKWKQSHQNATEEPTEKDPDETTQTLLVKTTGIVAEAVVCVTHEMKGDSVPHPASPAARAFIKQYKPKVDAALDRIRTAVRNSYNPDILAREWMKWPEVRAELVTVFREAAKMLEEVDGKRSALDTEIANTKDADILVA